VATARVTAWSRAHGADLVGGSIWLDLLTLKRGGEAEGGLTPVRGGHVHGALDPGAREKVHHLHHTATAPRAARHSSLLGQAGAATHAEAHLNQVGVLGSGGRVDEDVAAVDRALTELLQILRELLEEIPAHEVQVTWPHPRGSSTASQRLLLSVTWPRGVAGSGRLSYPR
jgi:hypothetical protein